MFGKSIVLSVFGEYLIKENKKICIIDCSFENNTLKIINRNLINNKKKFIENKKYIFCENKDNFYSDFKKYIDENKEIYDFILIDYIFYFNFIFSKYILELSDEIFFLIEPNITELEKAKSILEIFKYDFNISNKKIKIIYNKVNKYQISDDILREILGDYEVLTKIKYIEQYNLIINTQKIKGIDEEPYKIIFEKIFR